MKTNRLSRTRRAFVHTTIGTMGLGFGVGPSVLAANCVHDKPLPKKVAAIATVYHKNSHADVLVGKILDGWKQDGGSGPVLELASLFVDQFPEDDMSVKLAEKRGFRLCKTIREAIELDSGRVAVDGVLSIGEHGDYPRIELEHYSNS